MSAAPVGAAGAWTAIVGAVACAFTRPGFAIFADLVDGWVLTPGRRTVTRIVGVVDAGWARVTYDQRGTSIQRLVWSRQLLWYGVAEDRPLLLVVVRDPDGRQPDELLVTTDTDTEPAAVAAHYAGRWSVEVVFRDAKQHLGAEDPQTWTRQGPERAAALALWLHAAVWLWYIPTFGARRSWTPTPWYPRRAPRRSPTRSPRSADSCGSSEFPPCAPQRRSRPKSSAR